MIHHPQAKNLHLLTAHQCLTHWSDNSFIAPKACHLWGDPQEGWGEGGGGCFPLLYPNTSSINGYQLKRRSPKEQMTILCLAYGLGLNGLTTQMSFRLTPIPLSTVAEESCRAVCCCHCSINSLCPSSYLLGQRSAQPIYSAFKLLWLTIYTKIHWIFSLVSRCDPLSSVENHDVCHLHW